MLASSVLPLHSNPFQSDLACTQPRLHILPSPNQQHIDNCMR